LGTIKTLEQQRTKQQLFFRQPQPLKVEERQRQVPLLITSQRFGQPQRLAQPQAQVPAQTLRQASALKSSLLTMQSSLLRTPTPTKEVLKEKIKTGIIPLPKEKQSPLIKKLKEIASKGQSVDIVTGMKLKKTKTIGRRLPPNLALRKAQEYVDRNIEASFRLKVNPKKPKLKDIKQVTVSPKFRGSKRNPLYRVEHRKYRLDSPSEKKQIKLARRYKLI